MAYTITPWEVKGTIDYNKLIKDFGIEPLKELPSVFNENILFRRKVIFRMPLVITVQGCQA